MNWPTGTASLMKSCEVAGADCPVKCPIKRSPSPFPEGSQLELAKNWRVYCPFAKLVRFTSTRVVAPCEFEAFDRTGKFCRLLAPVSPSPWSLAVEAFQFRSIPNCVLE